MRQRLIAFAFAGFLLAGCAHAGAPTATTQVSTSEEAMAAKQTDPALVAALAEFAKEEGRKVTAANVPLSDGRGAAELRVRLNETDKALLVQLYRLHPHAIDAAQFPAGLVERTVKHLATLHHFKLPTAPVLDPSRLTTEIKTRTYNDQEGNILAYESWLVGDNYQLFGKYDLKGRILKVDMETWQ
jgi:hypothetical protein